MNLGFKGRLQIFVKFLLIISIIWAAYGLDLFSLQIEKKSEPFQYEVSVTLKLVQVYVTDKEGNPVTDLTQSDFRIFDNGKLVKITEFEKHVLTNPQNILEEEARVKNPDIYSAEPPRITRKFLLFFDFAFNDAKGILKARKAALHFINGQLLPEDEIGLISYDVFKGLTLHEYFTTEHDKVQEVIENFGAKKVLGRAANISRDYWSEFGSEHGFEANETSYKNQIKRFSKEVGI
jgi:VWFA-related protein